MILLTGTHTTSVPFEVITLTPSVFNTRQEASNHVRDHFSRVLKEAGACTQECLGEGWEMGLNFTSNEVNGGVTYRVYAERTGGLITYHLRADILHIVYREDNITVIDGQVNVLNPKSSQQVVGPDTLYWNVSPHRAVQIALSMALVSGYAVARISTGAETPKTYEEISAIVPEDDPITPMIIVYSMLKADNQYAFFHIQDGSLFLYSKQQGFLSVGENVQGFEDGAMCDPDRLYVFSPMYRDIPSTIDGAVQMFRGMFKAGPIVRINPNTSQIIDQNDNQVEGVTEMLDSERQFRQLLSEAFTPGLHWRDRVMRMVTLLDIDQNEVDTTSFTLMRIVAKYKLLKGANVIFSMFPCSVPDAQSP